MNRGDPGCSRYRVASAEGELESCVEVGELADELVVEVVGGVADMIEVDEDIVVDGQLRRTAKAREECRLPINIWDKYQF